MADSFNFQRVIANLERVKSTLPKVLANETKNYFVGEFNNQQWDGRKWKPSKRQENPKKTRDTAATLVQSGTLRRAVINSLQEATFKRIYFEVKDVDYAKVHNDGLRAGRGAGFQMPKRQFMGQTRKLGEIQRLTIDKTISKIWHV